MSEKFDAHGTVMADLFSLFVVASAHRWQAMRCFCNCQRPYHVEKKLLYYYCSCDIRTIIKEGGMGGTCSTHARVRYAYVVSLEDTP
jgi:hypothetical protein